MASTQTFLTTVLLTACFAAVAAGTGGLLAEYSINHDRSSGMAMVAKAQRAGAVCEQIGPTSFRVVDKAHPDKPFYTMTAGHFRTSGHDDVDGVATAMDGSRVGMSVNLRAHTCHVPFGIGDFALKAN